MCIIRSRLILISFSVFIEISKKNSFCQTTCPDLRCGHVGPLRDEGSHCPAMGGPLSLPSPMGTGWPPQRAQKHPLF